MPTTGDETVLEASVEHIGTLPSEVRRNLDHVRDLDRQCAELVGQLRRAEDAYVKRAEETVLGLGLGGRTGTGTGTGTGDGTGTGSRKRPRAGSGGGGGGASASAAAASTASSSIPTTEELRGRIMDPAELESLARLRRDTLQLAEEKIVVAEQTRAAIEEASSRIDADLARFEALLKGSGAFEVPSGAKPNDLAAIQVLPNSTEWILAKVISQDVETGTYQLADEDVESSKGEFEFGDVGVRGVLAAPSSPPPLVFVRSFIRFVLCRWFVSLISLIPSCWGSVPSLFASSRLSSCPILPPPQQSSQVYNLPESQVVVLGGVDRLSRGDVIYAVYPDTTSFYQAAVSQPPKRTASGEPFVLVQFKDDSDEHGVTHDKAVLLQHVMRVPSSAL